MTLTSELESLRIDTRWNRERTFDLRNTQLIAHLRGTLRRLALVRVTGNGRDDVAAAAGAAAAGGRRKGGGTAGWPMGQGGPYHRPQATVETPELDVTTTHNLREASRALGVTCTGHT